jgi:hypothetical protein
MTLDDGTPVSVVAVAGDRATVLSPRAAAPGEPVALKLDGGGAVRLKVQRCVRTGDEFVLEGRLLDATRAVLDALAALALPAGR